VGTGSFPGVKRGRGVTLTPRPLLVPWSRKGRAIPLLPPPWAVRPVRQCLSTCARVHFSLTFGVSKLVITKFHGLSFCRCPDVFKLFRRYVKYLHQVCIT